MSPKPIHIAQISDLHIKRPGALAYGQSITDACLGWDDSLEVLKVLSDAVATRRYAAGQQFPEGLSPSRVFRKYVTSYFGLCSTAMGAVRRACLCHMAKLTYHGLTKRCTRCPFRKSGASRTSCPRRRASSP